MNQAIVFDTETTGINEPEIIEAAWLPIAIDGSLLTGGECSRFKPSKAISLGALATHHIMDEDLNECPPSSSFRLPDGTEYLIGYNIDFDWNAIGKPEVKRIDVCAMCRHIWPLADSHSQSAMLYMLERESARDALVNAHSASADVLVCRVLLQHIMQNSGPFESFEKLWEASERMRVPTVMPFGKHKGMLIRDMPTDYKIWLLKQNDVDEYLGTSIHDSLPFVG